MSIRGKLLAVAGIAAAYVCWIQPRLVRWGATDEEVAGPYPGAELVPDGSRSPTMAITIDASPAEVWPWLLQMGSERGGWYSWDLLDNAGRRSAREIHPEWQDLAVGTMLKFSILGRSADAFRVRVIEPNRFLGLHGYSDLRGRWLDPDEPRPPAFMEAIWGFLLKELPHGRTRLVIGGYQIFRPRWVERFVVPWSFILLVWPMQARMMAVLKRNIEEAKAATASAQSAEGMKRPLAAQSIDRAAAASAAHR